MIHVCYSLRDESGTFSKFTGTSIESLLENTKSEVTIHVIHDSTLTPENREKFLSIVNLDIAELWEIEIENYPIAAVTKTMGIGNSSYGSRRTECSLP